MLKKYFISDLKKIIFKENTSTKNFEKKHFNWNNLPLKYFYTEVLMRVNMGHKYPLILKLLLT